MSDERKGPDTGPPLYASAVITSINEDAPRKMRPAEQMNPMALMLLKMLFSKWRSLIDEGKSHEARDDIDKAITTLDEADAQ